MTLLAVAAVVVVIIMTVVKVEVDQEWTYCYKMHNLRSMASL
jgi:hypothetical protein